MTEEEDMEANEQFLENVFLEAASLGDVPVIIGGDFNTKLENSPTLSGMVSSGRWSDAASLLATVNNTSPGDTYKTGIGTSRIDMLFMNSAATRLFKHCFVVEVPPEGIKRHKPVEGHWAFNEKREFAHRVRSIRGLPRKRTVANPEELNLIAYEAIEAETERFFEAYSNDDVDQLWESWCSMAEEYLVRKAATESGETDVVGDRRYYGRGRCTS